MTTKKRASSRTKNPKPFTASLAGGTPLAGVAPSQDDTILLEFSMSPLAKGDSVSAYVARSLDIIDRSGLDYRLNPMGTVVEGPWDQVLHLVKSCWQKMAEDCDRVSAIVKIDYRKGYRGRLVSKVESVERRLQKKLKKS